MVGLGHMRRNLLIAQSLARSRLRSVNLLVAESREATAFVNAMPPGTDCLTLPALRKDANGRCQARYLNVELNDLVKLRSETIRAALEAFDPDLLIVDYLPRGALCELDSALETLQSRGRTRFVLGLRDVLGDPVSVSKNWSTPGNEEAMRLYYDQVWVYGDSTVYDPILEYHLPDDLASKVRFTGYLDQRLRIDSSPPEDDDGLGASGLPAGSFVLCVVGGGQDGDRLAESFAGAEFPPGMTGVVVAGPFMSLETRRHLRERASVNPRLRIFDFLAEPTWLVNRAERVIGMGGYNTICEVLSFEKRALIVPRTKPRGEQLLRAERLRNLGLVDLLHPDELDSQALSEWMRRDLFAPVVRSLIDLNGHLVIPVLVKEILGGDPHVCRPKAHELKTRYAIH
jgi:predicted glycosyltransferase